MDRQNAKQLTNVIVIKHSNDLVLGLNLVEVPGDVLQFVCVDLLVDEVFDFFLPFNLRVDLLTCVEDSRYSGDNVGVESHSDQDDQYVGCCFRLVLRGDIAIPNSCYRNHGPVATCYVLHEFV